MNRRLAGAMTSFPGVLCVINAIILFCTYLIANPLLTYKKKRITNSHCFCFLMAAADLYLTALWIFLFQPSLSCNVTLTARVRLRLCTSAPFTQI